MAYCSGPYDCISGIEFCDVVVGTCETCSWLCQPERDLMKQCKELCPGFLSKQNEVVILSQSKAKPPTSDEFANLDRNPQQSVQETAARPTSAEHITLIAVSVLLFLFIILITIAIFAFSYKKFSKNFKKSERGFGLRPFTLNSQRLDENKLPEQHVQLMENIDRQERTPHVHTVKAQISIESKSTSNGQVSDRSNINSSTQTLPTSIPPTVKSIQNGKNIETEQAKVAKEAGSSKSILNLQDKNSKTPHPVKLTDNKACTNKSNVVNKASDRAHFIPNNTSKTASESGIFSGASASNGESQQITQQQRNPHKQTSLSNIPEFQSLVTMDEKEKVNQWVCDSKSKLTHQNDEQISTALKNKLLFENLRRIPMVEGYYSEGGKIKVFVDLLKFEHEFALQQLNAKTGESKERFLICHSADQD